jgi:hypothetical protein
MTPRPKPETIAPPKEAPVPNKMTPKERCLALLARNGSASPSLMMQRCHIASEELKAIVAGEEFKAWPCRGGRSRMTTIYTLQDGKDPRTPEMLAGPTRKAKKKAPAAKAVLVAASVPRDGGAKPTPRPAKAAATFGDTPLAAVIADLEARRAKIDTAIETLRALA